MVEGKYPNYMSVIPQDAPYSLKADRQALLKAVRNVAHFTDPSRAVTTQPNDPLYQGEEITMLLMPMLVID